MHEIISDEGMPSRVNRVLIFTCFWIRRKSYFLEEYIIAIFKPDDTA